MRLSNRIPTAASATKPYDGRSLRAWPVLPALAGLLLAAAPGIDAAPIPSFSEAAGAAASSGPQERGWGWVPEGNLYGEILAAARGYKARSPALPALPVPPESVCEPAGHFPFLPIPKEEHPGGKPGTHGGGPVLPPAQGGPAGGSVGGGDPLQSVPEPGSLLLLGAGLLGLWAMRPSLGRKN